MLCFVLRLRLRRLALAFLPNTFQIFPERFPFDRVRRGVQTDTFVGAEESHFISSGFAPHLLQDHVKLWTDAAHFQHRNRQGFLSQSGIHHPQCRPADQRLAEALRELAAVA